MFMVNEGEAALIRAAYESGGELAAGAELCRLFPGITDAVKARQAARSIAAWQPLAPLKMQDEPAPSGADDRRR